jgi:hypothetical protein
MRKGNFLAWGVLFLLAAAAVLGTCLPILHCPHRCHDCIALVVREEPCPRCNDRNRVTLLNRWLRSNDSFEQPAPKPFALEEAPRAPSFMICPATPFPQDATESAIHED